MSKEDFDDLIKDKSEMAILIEKAYIDSLTLNIDGILEWLQEGYNKVKKLFGDMWDKLLEACNPNLKKKEENKNDKKVL